MLHIEKPAASIGGGLFVIVATGVRESLLDITGFAEGTCCGSRIG